MTRVPFRELPDVHSLPPDLSTFLRELVGAWGCWAPTMTADASRLAYISDRNGTPQLWVQELGQPVDTATLIELSEDPVVSVRWSPDGAWLGAAVATGGGVRTEVWVARPDGSNARRVAGSGGQHATLGPWLRHGHRLVVSIPAATPDALSHCDIVDPVTGHHAPLARGDLIDVMDLSADDRFVLLRDGRRGAHFCVVVDRVVDVDNAVLPYPETGSTDRGLLRPAPPGDESMPWMVYLVTDAGRPRCELIAAPIGADGSRKGAGILAARDDAELEDIDADEDGRQLVLTWNVAGRSEIELLDAATGQRRPVPTLPGAVVSGAVMSRDGRYVVACVEGPSQPRSLWRLDIDDGTWADVASCAFRPSRPMVTPTLETLVSHDGLEISGWLYCPQGQETPAPTMLSLHGGPEAQERPVFSPQHQVLAAAGIAVFAPNVRGSSGFGRAFVHADDRYGRYDAIADVASCAYHLTSTRVADPRWIAVTGRSYGGYLTLAALVVYPDLFAAGVDICGMSDLLTFYRDTEPWIGEAATSKYGDPVTDGTLLRDLSPLNHVERITAPVLVVHGELDTNVPIGEAHQIVAALRALDRPVDYLQLDGEGHEYRRAASKITLIETITQFLTRALA
jgi:dipeptidyl aminopeptidase/acylaminoacyl peptidase